MQEQETCPRRMSGGLAIRSKIQSFQKELVVALIKTFI